MTPTMVSDFAARVAEWLIIDLAKASVTVT